MNPWFNPDPTLYIEFVILVALFAGGYRLYVRSEPAPDADTEPTTLGAGAYVSLYVVFALFVSLTAAVAVQGLGYLGNMLLTTPVIYIMTVGSLALLTSRFKKMGLNESLIRTCDFGFVLSLAAVMPYVISVIDNERITPDFSVIDWLTEFRGVPYFVFAVFPIVVTLVVRSRYVGLRSDENYALTHGLLLACAYVASIGMALDFMRGNDYVMLFRGVIVCFYTSILLPWGGDRFDDGFTAGLSLSVVSSWVSVLSRPIFEGVYTGSDSYVNYVLASIILVRLVDQRRRYPQNATLSGVATLLGVSMTARVVGGVTVEYLNDFGILTALLSAIASGAALYSIQFSPM
tara:strand:- start:1157 stop:2197 length:1041 start_codon:yes stop_codon:yes gene_type:complete